MCCWCWLLHGEQHVTNSDYVLCSWLYLGGALSSAMSVLLLMRLGSYFLGGRAFVFQAELYVGLLVFIGYVLFDTQVLFSDHPANLFQEQSNFMYSMHVATTGC